MITTRIKLITKIFPFILTLLFIVISCNKNEQDIYKQVQLSKGLPDVLKPLEKDLPFKNFSYAILDTDTDTLQVFFGTFMQGSDRGYWFGIESNGIPAHFSTVSLEEVDSLEYRTKDIDIDFNEDRNRIALRVIEVDSLTYKFAWLDNSELSKHIALKYIAKPMRKDQQFPAMYFESMSGEEFSPSQFENKFVVINWWATWCKPCIEEIPGLNKIVKKYENNDNVRFIAITDDPKSRVLNFLKKKDFIYEMTFANEEVRSLFENSYPINLIIDPSGKITYISKGAGSNTPNEIESSLKQQLEAFNSKNEL